MRKFFIYSALVLFAFILIGCETVSKKNMGNSMGALEPSAIYKFNDVPVPAGFNFLQQDSFSFENSGVRVGVLKYQGKANIEQVVNFYKEQMAMYNWNLLNVIEYGERLMNFERDNETCIISLLPKGSAVMVAVSLGPKSQNLARKPKQTIK